MVKKKMSSQIDNSSISEDIRIDSMSQHNPYYINTSSRIEESVDLEEESSIEEDIHPSNTSDVATTKNLSVRKS